MKKNNILLALTLFLSIIIIGCETKSTAPNDGSTDSTNAVVVTGQVVSDASGDGLSGALIKITDGTTVKGTTTGTDGKFSVSYNLETDMDLTIVVFKAGYFQDTTTVFAIVNTVVTVPLFQLRIDESSNAGDFSGKAASIYLASQSDDYIGVKESGSIESAQIVFEVMDSSGVVIGESNAIEVSFRFGSTPNGGEYLYPSSVMTNALGKAAVSLNTGTIAGVSQIIAEAIVDGKPISSKPINITIHGGFPNIDHFSIASNQLNYAYYHWIGKQAEITVLLGDKYSNPVRPGTSVYFNSDAAVIEGSALTNDLGLATVTLLSGEPKPNDAVYGPGFFYVHGSTIDENEVSLSTETRILFSGLPVLALSPTTVDIANGGSQAFSYTVTDEFGNPLASSNSYKITLETKGDAEASGDISFTMPDVQQGFSQFFFSVSDTKDDTVKVSPITIKLTVDGPNGKASTSVSGTTR